MAHYAYLDQNNVVINVIVGKDENELIDGLEPEIYYAQNTLYKVKRTSYNGKIRVRYAGIGYRYDEIRDAFIPPQPYISWTFNENTLNWDPPIPYPNDGKIYYWDESTKEWKINE